MSGDGQNRELDELAALYATGALGDEERAAVEARLAAGDDALRAAIADLSGTIEALASAAPALAPRPETLEALLARIAASSADSSPVNAPAADAPAARAARKPSSRRRSRRSGAPTQATAEQTGDLVVLRGNTAVWTRLAEGVETRTLFVDRHARRVTMVVRLAPGATYPAHYHAGAEECLVLQGDLRVGDYVLGPGDYQRAPQGSWHGEQRTMTGCVCVVIAPL